ncbi:MAG TPA: 2-isopropylmalate synthase [Chloroflexota bacterium]
MDDVVRVFDTTLRDGEQSPGASMSSSQKVEVARQLDAMGVDIIEAGFPAASPGDQEAVMLVSRSVRNASVAALARCTRTDIETAARALKDAQRPVLHVFVATSDIHLKYKLRRSRTEIMQGVGEMVAYARSLCPTVEFSAEDATRSDLDYLACVCDVAVQAGARTINLPDTVGYAVPEEYGAMFRYVRERVDHGVDTIFSAHCHDDLGLATANTLAAVRAGARQVEVTVNGIGERAGNAPLEEVVMALQMRGSTLGVPATAIKTQELVPTSRLVSEITGVAVQINKAVVGANAFAHEAGIHQDGVIKERTTYEIMSAADVGWESNRLVLGRHSGRHGVAHRLSQLGLQVDGELLESIYASFISVADREKEVTDAMLRELATNAVRSVASHSTSSRPVFTPGQPS